MTSRPAVALTALALAATTATLAGCSGGGSSASSAPKPSSVADAALDTTPLSPGDYRVAFEGALTGNLQKGSPAQCDTSDGDYHLTLTGTLNGASTVVDIDNLQFKGPGPVALKDNTNATADIAQSDLRKDWRNQLSNGGDGTITYNPDGRTGSFDISVPEISYDTAVVLPNNPRLHLAGRWSCGAGASPS